MTQAGASAPVSFPGSIVMSKIQMIRRNRVFSVDARLVTLLESHGGYQRRDMQAQPATAPPPVQPDTQGLEAKRAVAQAKRDAASAAKAAAQAAPKDAPKTVAKKAAKKAVAKTAATNPAPDKDASE